MANKQTPDMRNAWFDLMLNVQASWLRSLNDPSANKDMLRNHLACFQRIERLAGFKFPGRVV